MWLIVAAGLLALILGTAIVAWAAWGVWRSGRRLFRTMGEVTERASLASDQLSELSRGVSTEPERPLGRTM